MRAWHLDRPASSSLVDLSRATGLIASLNAATTDAFAAAVLQLLDPAVAISQCTVFVYESSLRPRTLSVADHRGGRYLRNVADLYARQFYALDGNQAILGASAPGRREPLLTLHQQASADIAHEGYRLACYQEPNVSDRIALVARYSDEVWLSINLYRDSRYGCFSADEILRIEMLAPMVVHAAKQHYALTGHREASIPQLMIARLQKLCPALTKREIDALRGVLEGRTAHEIGELIGVKASSVVTYQKRAYQRLGISSQRQLFALCLDYAGV